MDVDPQKLRVLLADQIKKILDDPAKAEEMVGKALLAEMESTRTVLSLAKPEELRGNTPPFKLFEDGRSGVCRIKMHIPGINQDSFAEVRFFHSKTDELIIRVAPGGNNLPRTINHTIDTVVEAFKKSEEPILSREPSEEGLSRLKELVLEDLSQDPQDFAMMYGGLANMIVSFVRRSYPRWARGDFSEGRAAAPVEKSDEKTDEKETADSVTF